MEAQLAIVGTTLSTPSCSSLEALVLEHKHYDALDPTVYRMLSYPSAMRRTHSEGEHRRPPATELRRQWHVATMRAEMAVRRALLYQAWAKDPICHRQVLAAVFATQRVDHLRGVSRLVDGRVVEHSTPWAHQFVADIRRLGALEAASWVSELADQPATLLFDRRTDFLAIDPRELRTQELSVSVGAEIGGAEGPAVIEVGSDGDAGLLLPHGCPQPECGRAFRTANAAWAHFRFGHRARRLIHMLVVANQCPYCMTVFSTRHVARQQAVESGRCLCDKAKWEYVIQSPASLECLVCDCVAHDLAHIQEHVRSHHPGPTSFMVLLEDSDDGAEHRRQPRRVDASAGDGRARRQEGQARAGQAAG